MPLFKAQMSWAQFTAREIVEILDEDLPQFERVITPRSEGGLGRLKPYTEGNVVPALDPNHWSAHTDEHPYAGVDADRSPEDTGFVEVGDVTTVEADDAPSP